MDGDESNLTTRTLFVRNLPYSATSEQLEELFGQVGPIKRCFVVKDKESEQCKGFGYVTFAQKDDIDQLKDKALMLGGRKIMYTLANKKPSRPPANKRDAKQSAKESSLEDRKPDVDRKADIKQTVDRSQTKAVDSSAGSLNLSAEAKERAIVLRGLGESDVTKDDIARFVGNMIKVRQLRFPVTDSNGDTTAVILYRGKRDAVLAVQQLCRKQLGGKKVSVAMLLNQPVKVAAQSRTRQATTTASKKSRLIVRNLDFKCTVAGLRKTFEPFGVVTEVDIPKRPNGKRFGFGIVQLSTVAEAAKAIAALNEKEIFGRTVAIDWAVPKSKFLKDSERSDNKEEDDGSVSDEEEMEVDGGEESNSDREEEKLCKTGRKGGKVTNKGKKIKEMESDEDEESGDDDDGESDEEDDGEDDDVDDNNDEDDDDNDEDDDDEDDDDSESEKKSTKQKREWTGPPRKCDVDEGRTVFIRNLSFDSMEEDLEELLEKFGEIVYVKIVMDPNTDHSKGTAFVQFTTKEAASRCLAESEGTARGVVLDGRKLCVSVALPKTRAVEITGEKKTKEKVSTRNLHLLREGLIRAGTSAANGMSKEDTLKREKVEAIVRQKLRNPSIFVSTTRLCVRNIPTSVDDANLRRVFIKASGNPKSRITESRIMRDLTRVSGQGMGKSRGYGFVNFTAHEDALAALRATNNNPAIFGNEKRLIVEFSLENRTALLAKEKRLERAMVKQTNFSSAKTGINKSGVRQPKVMKPMATFNSAPLADPKSKSEKSNAPVVKVKSNAPNKLPSHRGPKIRHVPRPVVKPKKSVEKSTVNAPKQESKKQKKRNRGERDRKELRDDVDKMIDRYKTKIMSATNLHQNANKWQ